MAELRNLSKLRISNDRAESFRPRNSSVVMSARRARTIERHKFAPCAQNIPLMPTQLPQRPGRGARSLWRRRGRRRRRMSPGPRSRRPQLTTQIRWEPRKAGRSASACGTSCGAHTAADAPPQEPALPWGAHGLGTDDGCAGGPGHRVVICGVPQGQALAGRVGGGWERSLHGLGLPVE